MFRTRHSFASVVDQLAEGFRNGSVELNSIAAQNPIGQKVALLTTVGELLERLELMRLELQEEEAWRYTGNVVWLALAENLWVELEQLGLLLEPEWQELEEREEGASLQQKGLEAVRFSIRLWREPERLAVLRERLAQQRERLEAEAADQPSSPHRRNPYQKG